MKKKIRITALILACSMLFAGCSCAPEVSMPDTGSNISSSESSTENSENSENQESSENSSEADKTESKDESSSSPETDSKDESSETTESKEETKKPETEQSEKPETSKPETEKPDDKPTQNSDYTAQWNLSSTWQDGGKYCGGYDVVITNNTGKQVESWTATVTVPNGFEIISGWNAKYKVNGSTLTVTNESYNGTIANGGEISFGFNYSSPKEFTPS